MVSCFLLPGTEIKYVLFFYQLSQLKDREDHIFWSEILGKALREAVTHHLLRSIPGLFSLLFITRRRLNGCTAEMKRDTSERMCSGKNETSVRMRSGKKETSKRT